VELKNTQTESKVGVEWCGVGGVKFILEQSSGEQPLGLAEMHRTVAFL
jgi:hypothetical protein